MNKEPADIRVSDEIRSIKFYLSLAFPSDEIRHERPDEDDPYTMLVEPPSAVVSAARGKFMSERSIPLVVQRWCDDYMTATEYVENILRLFHVGRPPGDRSRVPVWRWDKVPVDHDDDPDTPPILRYVNPDIEEDEPDRYLRVSSLEGRVLPGEKVGTHVAIIDVTFEGWRRDFKLTEQMIEAVEIAPIEP